MARRGHYAKTPMSPQSPQSPGKPGGFRGSRAGDQGENLTQASEVAQSGCHSSMLAPWTLSPLGGRRQASERVVATAGGGGGLACFSGTSPAGRRAGQGCRAWATHRDPVCVVCRAAVPHHASSSPSYEATCRRPRRSPSRPRAGPGSAAGALPWQHKDSGGVMVWPGLPLTSVISWRWWLSPLPALPLGPFPSLGRDAILRGGLRRPPSHPLVLEGGLPTK